MRDSLTDKILLILQKHGALSVKSLLSYLAPVATRYRSPGLLARRLSQTLYHLNKKAWVKLRQRRKGLEVSITNGGLRRIAKNGPQILLAKPPAWDKKFRIVAFDIPLSRRSAAESFRRRLKGLNFAKLQRSLWIYPYPCEQQITQLAGHYGLKSDITVLLVEKISNAGEFKKIFNL